MPYGKWSRIYNESIDHERRETWEKGILSELYHRGVTSGRILDAGAGTGIGAILLRELGEFSIISVDRSEEMLHEAEKYSDETYVRDLSNLGDIVDEVDFVVSGFDTINYLNKIQFTGLLSWVNKHLAS